jgi:hypothetical protein
MLSGSSFEQKRLEAAKLENRKIQPNMPVLLGIYFMAINFNKKFFFIY